MADEWQRQGLGTALLAMLSVRAREEGVRRFTVDMVAGNTAIRSLIEAAGGQDFREDGEHVSGHLDLAI